MEPMALGSPSSPGNSYLPQFLIGDPTMTPPRTTLSPTKVGSRSLAFGQSPSSPKDAMNRSNVFQNRNPLSPHQGMPSGSFNHHAGGHNLSTSVSGPPIHGLFDSLATNDRNLVQTTSLPHLDATASSLSIHRQITSPFSPNSQTQAQPPPPNDNLYTPKRPSIIPGPKHNFTAFPSTTNLSQTVSSGTSGISSGADCWVTVFGFPQSATSMILSHFSQCGTIVNKMQPQNVGNWLHLRFTSRLECDRALNYNEKILNNCFMIGVIRCKDPAVLELEQRENLENNSCLSNTPSLQNTGPATPRNMNNSSIRPLAHVAYKTVQSPSDVVASPSAPTKNSGILDRAMDFFLGW